MPELLIYTQKITSHHRRERKPDEVWERLYFLEEKNPSVVHNVFVKLSVEISIDPQHVKSIMVEISKKLIADSTYENTADYEFHAKKPFKPALVQQYALTNVTTPTHRFLPYQIGLAVNRTLNDKGEYGNLEIKYREIKENNEVKYTDPRDGVMSSVYKRTVCLNIHFKPGNKTKFYLNYYLPTIINSILTNVNQLKNNINMPKLITYYDGIDGGNLLKNGFMLRDKGGREGVLTRKAYTKYLLDKAKKLGYDICQIEIHNRILTQDEKNTYENIYGILTPLIQNLYLAIGNSNIINTQIDRLRVIKDRISGELRRQREEALDNTISLKGSFMA